MSSMEAASTTMPRLVLTDILRVDELATMICSHSYPNTCAVMARVCRLWYDPAMNKLWKELSDPVPAFRLLATMIKTPEEWAFTRPISQANWPRFMSISSRIRKLDIAIGSSHLDKTVGGVAMNQIIKSRTVDLIFPALRDLNVQIVSPLCVPSLECLFTPTITAFSLSVGCDETEFFSPLFADISAKLTRLERLELNGCLNGVFGFTAALEMLPRHKYLKGVVLEAPFAAIPKLSNTLRQLPTITSIELNDIEPRGDDWATQLIGIAPFGAASPTELELGCYNSLLNCDIINTYITCRNLQTLILDRIVPSEDDKLYIEDRPTTVLFRAIADVCRGITVLHVALDFILPVLDFDTVKPILSLPLRVLCLAHHTHLNFTNEDVTTLAQSLGPTLEELDLNHFPRSELRRVQRADVIPTPYMDLSALASFAQYCPKLVELSLSLDASIRVELPPSDHPKFPLSLRYLVLGNSEMDSAPALFNHLKSLSNPHAKGARAWEVAAPGLFWHCSVADQVVDAVKALGKLDVGNMDVEIPPLTASDRFADLGGVV